MAVTERSVIEQGTHVRLRRAALPMDPALVGRTGVVVHSSEYSPNQYGVVLDGEQDVRVFAPAELEVVERLALPAEAQAAKKREALP